MQVLRPASFLFSLCLHTGVIALAFFLPQGAPPLVDLTAPVIDIGIYTIGKPGAAPTAPVAPTAPQAPAVPPATPPPAPPVEPPKPVEAPTPIDPPKPVELAKPVEPPKPVAPPKPVEQPKPVEPPKPTTPAKPAPPRRSADDILNAALGDLKSLVSDPDGTAGGDGPGGSGGDGIGLVGSYMQSLVSRIKPHWEYGGRADRRNPTAMVHISIARDGTILEAAISQSSGDAAFDGSVLKAVRDTIRVEPPPTPDLRQVQVPFAYEDIRR